MLQLTDCFYLFFIYNYETACFIMHKMGHNKHAEKFFCIQILAH